LRLSRLDGGPPSYEFEEVDVSSLVRGAVNELQTGTSVNVRYKNGGRIPPICADPAALEQMVVNLLENAVKYSDGSGDVAVQVESDGAQVTIRIRDACGGLDPADLPHIFDKFYRGRSHSDRGFGLGLTIAREIVRAHKGSIMVSNRPGVCCEFRVVLPIKRFRRVRTPAAC